MYLMSDLEMRAIRLPIYSDIAVVMRSGGEGGVRVEKEEGGGGGVVLFCL